MRPALVIYPGERVNESGTTVGRILVTSTGDTYEVAGGPPNRSPDAGGHTKEPTPAGIFSLGHAEHHISKNWPSSVVPWGAKLRERDGVVQYDYGQGWKTASGPHGTVTAAVILFAHRSLSPSNRNVAGRQAREMFYDQKTGVLMSEWKQNDFGKWSWNLMRDGHRTVYYIHTTPEDEKFSDANLPFELEESHGCLHIRPKDREKMVAAKALRAGAFVRIHPYGVRLPG